MGGNGAEQRRYRGGCLDRVNLRVLRENHENQKIKPPIKLRVEHTCDTL